MKKMFGGLLVAATILTPIAPAAAQANGERVQIAQRERGDRGDRGPRGPEARRGGDWNGGQRVERQRPQPQPQTQRVQQPQPQAPRGDRGGWNRQRGDGQRQWQGQRGNDQRQVQQRQIEQRQAQQRQWQRNNDQRQRGGTYDRNRDGRTDRQWDRNRDGRVDRQWDRNRNGQVDRRYRDNRGNNNWNRQWRADRRYDWRSYRDRNRSHYRMPRYYNPYRGRSYTRFSIGFGLSSLFYSQRYWINDPWYYRLPPAYGDYRWIRYYDDALLVDIYSGRVVDVIYDFFW